MVATSRGLNPNAVHLWVFPLDVSDEEREKLLPILSPEELRRARRFHFEHDRQRYVVGRGRLREILAFYLVTPPETIIFAYNEFGKPFVASPVTSPLHFNLSHSDAWGVVGITQLPKIGVDIEKIKDTVDILAIARRFFAAGEVSALLKAPTHQQREFFFSCWTRKEAFIKAIGRGLTFSLQDFEVTIDPQEVHPRLTFLTPEIPGLQQWHFFSFEPLERFTAAAAVFSHPDVQPEFKIFHYQNMREPLWKPLLD